MTATQMDPTDAEVEPSIVSSKWGFNIFLDKIGESLSDKDLDRMKFYCSEGDIGRAALSKAKSSNSFFTLLRDNGFLDSYNLLHLQAMLWHIGRKDLHQDTVKYARECRRQPVYFFTPKEKPANGYRFIKFHIGGSEINRQNIENLRGTVAGLLCIDPKHVLISGHEPSNSTVITFMIPEEAVPVLKDLSSEDKAILRSVKVDIIFIDDEEIPIADFTGEEIEKPTTLSEMKAVTQVLRERDRLRRELDKLQALIVERTEELDQARSNENILRQSRDQAMLAFLTLLYQRKPVNRIIDSLVSKSALVYFKHCLEKFQSKFPGEMDTIEILLEAKELVVSKNERDYWKQQASSWVLQKELEANELRIRLRSHESHPHNGNRPRLRLDGQMIRKAGVIEVGINFTTTVTQRGHFIEPQMFYQIEADRALQEISNMLNPQQRVTILRHFEIEESEYNLFLDHVELFLAKLYQLKNQVSPLNFAQETIRKLDDKLLDEKVHEVVINFLEKCDAIAQQDIQRARTVQFMEGSQKRPMGADVLQSLQKEPEKLRECLNILQGLADTIEV